MFEALKMATDVFPEKAWAKSLKQDLKAMRYEHAAGSGKEKEIAKKYIGLTADDEKENHVLQMVSRFCEDLGRC